jgi:hypothetical protein
MWPSGVRFRGRSWLWRAGRRELRTLLGALTLAAMAATPAPGQVFEMGGGASSLFRAEGGSVHVYGSSYSARVDVGVFGKPRLGFLLDTPFRGYSWGLGDQTFSFPLATDLFNSSFLYGRGLSASRKNERSSLLVFVGATSSQFYVPFFNVARADTPIGLVFYERQIRPSLRFFSQNVFSARQTFIQTLQWTPAKKTVLAMAAGIGSNQHYWATSFDFDRHWIAFRGSYALAGNAFQRIHAASSPVTESNRENLRLDLLPTRNLGFSVVRQNLLAPAFSRGGPSVRATVNGFTASASGLAGFQLHGSLFESQSKFGRTEGTLWGVRRGIGRRIDAGVDFLYSRFGRFVARTTTSSIHERLTQRLSFTQAITHTMGQTSASYGGQLSSNLLSVGVDYLTLFVPFGPGGRGGFEQAMQVSLRFQFRNAHFDVSTNVDPLGREAYTAYGTGYAYGSAIDRSGHGGGGASLPRYLIQGTVVDEEGRPVAGVALRVDGQIVFSDSEGNFSLRERKPRGFPVEVLFDQFMFPGTYQLVSAPRIVTAAPEEKAAPFKVVLRRLR